MKVSIGLRLKGFNCSLELIGENDDEKHIFITPSKIVTDDGETLDSTIILDLIDDCNSKEILKDILLIGKFIEENIKEPKSFFTTDKNSPKLLAFLIDEHLDYIESDMAVYEAFKNKKDEFEKIIYSFIDKYGITSFKSREIEKLNYKRFDIIDLLIKSHYIYILFMVINYLKGKKKVLLKNYKFNNCDNDSLAEAIIRALNNEKNASFKMFYDSSNKTFGTKIEYNDPIDVGFYELRNTLFAINNNYNDSFTSLCESCGNPFISTNKNKKYCDDYECIKKRDRYRKQKSNNKKKRGK